MIAYRKKTPAALRALENPLKQLRNNFFHIRLNLEKYFSSSEIPQNRLAIEILNYLETCSVLRRTNSMQKQTSDRLAWSFCYRGELKRTR